MGNFFLRLGMLQWFIRCYTITRIASYCGLFGINRYRYQHGNTCVETSHSALISEINGCTQNENLPRVWSVQNSPDRNGNASARQWSESLCYRWLQKETVIVQQRIRWMVLALEWIAGRSVERAILSGS